METSIFSCTNRSVVCIRAFSARSLWKVNRYGLIGGKHLEIRDADAKDTTLMTLSPDRPGPVAIHDIDADGQAEVLCFWVDTDATEVSKWDLSAIRLMILDGATGAVKTDLRAGCVASV